MSAAEHFAHMLPKVLLVDEVVRFGGAESVGQGSGVDKGQATGPRKDEVEKEGA